MDAMVRAVRKGFVAEVAVPAVRAAFDGAGEWAAGALREALSGYGVVVLRGLSLEPARLEGLGRAMGRPRPVPVPGAFPPHPESAYVQILSTEEAGARPAPDTARWHTDQSFRPEPTRYTALQARTVPDRGGDTLFADMVGAYAQLPPRWRALLDGAVGTHVYPLGGHTARHPAVVTVPESGQRALYINPMCRTEIRTREGNDVPIPFDALVAHATRDALVHRHRWRPGDLVVWDNRRVLHRATPLGPGARRVMHRITVAAPGAPPA